MNDVIDFLTSKELIVVYVVVLLVCIAYFIIYLINKTCQNRKKKQNTRELNRLVEQIEEKLDQEQESIPVNNYPTQIEEITQNILYVENNEEKEEFKDNIEIPEIKEVKIEEPKIEVPIIENTTLSVNTIEEVEQPTIIELQEESIEEKIENIVLDSMPVATQETEELQYTNIEPNPEEAQAELRRLTEELQKAQEEAKNISLTSLEEEQEANAIISLEEFLKRSQEKHYETSIEQYEEDDENKPISIEELEKMKNQIIVEPIENEPKEEMNSTQITEIKEPYQEKMVLDEFNNIKIEEQELKPYAEDKKFKSSPVISPVYGIENNVVQENSMELENTANYEKLDEEIKKTNEFLMTLKELQKNLQ